VQTSIAADDFFLYNSYTLIMKSRKLISIMFLAFAAISFCAAEEAENEEGFFSKVKSKTSEVVERVKEEVHSDTEKTEKKEKKEEGKIKKGIKKTGKKIKKVTGTVAGKISDCAYGVKEKMEE